MAKHPHRLMLNQKKTWRCTLPGCSYFIHVGLAHILPGKQSICWECGEEFTLDDASLQDDQPICANCRARKEGWDLDAMSQLTEAKLALARAGVKSVDELDSAKRHTIEAISGVKFSVLEQPDEIEVIEDEGGHAPDCGIYDGTECTCK